MSMPRNPYVEQPVAVAVNADGSYGAMPHVPERSDLPDCNPYPLGSMVRVDVKKQHECLRFV